MATKKQRREAALAKREKFFEEMRRDGLKAQQRDRERRERKRAEAAADAKRRENLQYTQRIARALNSMGLEVAHDVESD